MQITQSEYNQCQKCKSQDSCLHSLGHCTLQQVPRPLWELGIGFLSIILDAVKLNHKKIIEVHGWKTG